MGFEGFGKPISEKIVLVFDFGGQYSQVIARKNYKVKTIADNDTGLITKIIVNEVKKAD